MSAMPGTETDSALDDGVVNLANPHGSARVVLVCEHASRLIPGHYSGLGLNAEQLSSHIAWDPGALELSERLSQLLDAPLVSQRYSRLLYDCNRPPEASDAIPSRSEIHLIPGNVDIDATSRAMRERIYYFPFRDALTTFLDSRVAMGIAPVLVTIHSFTPVYFGKPRAVEIGILHDADDRLAVAMAGDIARITDHVVRLNEPYGPTDGVTHTLREHALPRGIANVMIEIRNDLVADGQSVNSMAELLAGSIGRALQQIEGQTADA